MNLSELEFIDQIKSGKSEFDLNRTESLYVDPIKYKELIKKYDHTHKSATEHLTTDYSNGFTICGICGSYAQLGKGFSKHISNGCVFCEGESKHRKYQVEASPKIYGGFPARTMCSAFDDGMSYTFSKLVKEKYFNLAPINS